MWLNDIWDDLCQTGEDLFDRTRDKIGDALERVEKFLPFSVTPIPGSVVYCKLLAIEHSGIYVEKDRIVHLDGNGEIEAVSPGTFINRLNGWNTALQIYVSCYEGRAVGSSEVVKRAMQMVGRRRDYNFVLDNCHQFAAGCLVGEFDNPINFFWMLEKEVKNVLGGDSWRSWAIEPEKLFR